MPLELDNNAAAEMEALEWEQLRVEGKPLLSGAAFGATPLLWVACRAQPCLVHIFCDTQLQVPDISLHCFLLNRYLVGSTIDSSQRN